MPVSRIDIASAPVGIEIGIQVGKMHEAVAVFQERIEDRREDAGLVAAEMAGSDEIQGRPRFGLMVVVPMGIVPAAAAGDLLRRQSKQEEILFSGFLRHLDGCAVAGAECQRPIHHEFHV